MNMSFETLNFETTALSERIGTEVRIEIKELLTPEAGKALRSLLVERGILVFKRLNLTDEQQVAFARLMGAVREEGEKGIYKITLDKKENARADYLKGSFLWHIDGTHDNVPPFATLLTGHVLSAIGGQTEFANSYAAYEELPDATKERINALRGVHSVEVSMTRADIEQTAENLAHWRSIPDKLQNLVWTHKNGRKSLVIGCHASHVDGMEKSEGRQLLEDLLAWSTSPRFVYRHEWDKGDLIIWDNTGVLHRVEPYPLDSGRMMHRTTLMGDEPFA